MHTISGSAPSLRRLPPPVDPLDGHTPRYRADIDGMRAIAVLSVVVFHLLREALPAGFLGVDIFFVISGFLITRILVREAEAREYSILRFYDRRIRRIMPALLFVIAFCTIAVTLLYLPQDAVGYAKSVFGTFAFVSNIYFWRDTDYFSEDATTKPLLHTWSLGVEEQFYLLFPFLVLGLMRLGGRRATFWGIVAISSASFGLATIAEFVAKGLPAFYLLPTRVWELGTGATIAASRVPTRIPVRAMTMTALVGLVIVIAALAWFMPAYYSPLPPPTLAVAGTALVIWAGASDNGASRLIGAKPLVFIGLISYSLYLWHWPVYVFGRYLLIRPPSALEGFGMVLLSLGLAAFSWRFVEKPFRGHKMPTAAMLSWIVIPAFILCVISAVLLWTQGAPGRFDAKVTAYNSVAGTHYRCPVTDYIPFGGLYACPLALSDREPKNADLVLFGNSHAQMYAPAVQPFLEKHHLAGLLVPANGCLPTAHINVTAQCGAIMERNIQAISALPQARTIIIATTWPDGTTPLVDRSARLVGRPSLAYLADFRKTLDVFRRAGRKVILVGPVPRPGYNVASTTAREMAFQGKVSSPLLQSRAVYDREFGPAEAWLDRLPAGVWIVRPSTLFCNPETCSFLLDGRPAYADDNHLSSLIMPLVSPLFDKALEQVTETPPLVQPSSHP